MSGYILIKANARRIPLADCSVQCCITSPPYFGLRDYEAEGQLGLEPTPDAYVASMVEVFREIRRVLRDDGTLWLNLGDCYSATGKSGRGDQGKRWAENGVDVVGPKGGKWSPAPPGLKPKDLVGIPWIVAFALRSDGWYLRSEIVWHKPNPMPESITDRPGCCHEKLFLLAKSVRYHYDGDAIAEPAVSTHPSGNGYKREERLSYSDVSGARGNDVPWTPKAPVIGEGRKEIRNGTDSRHRSSIHGGQSLEAEPGPTRNARNVWTITTKPFPGAHFATFPPELPERCIKAGCPEGGIVLDPFNGAGTTGVVATGLGRRYVGLDINPKYLAMSARRISRPHARIRTDRPEEPLPLFS